MDEKQTYIFYERTGKGDYTGKTFAVIKAPGVLAIGMSRCSKKDQFEKRLGRSIATGRAEKMLWKLNNRGEIRQKVEKQRELNGTTAAQLEEIQNFEREGWAAHFNAQGEMHEAAVRPWWRTEDLPQFLQEKVFGKMPDSIKERLIEERQR